MAKNGGVGVSVNRSLAGKLGPGQVNGAVPGQIQASGSVGVAGQQVGGAAKVGVAAAAASGQEGAVVVKGGKTAGKTSEGPSKVLHEAADTVAKSIYNQTKGRKDVCTLNGG